MRKALKLALEALESMKETLAEHDEPTTFNEDQAIIAIKEALAQPEKGLFIDLIAQHDGLAEELAQPEQGPWVGLTDEEIESCANWRWMTTCRAIEAKLKEKNT